MAQVNWLYLDDAGGKHRVGLYHGDQSGHLMIHCNLRVVQVDFSVKTARTYSFFIEDELCEVELTPNQNGGFGYAFSVNKEVDTPRNQVRRNIANSDRRSMLYLIGFVLIFLTGLVVVYRYNKDKQMIAYFGDKGISSQLTPKNVQRLQVESQTAVATLFLVNEGAQRKIFYSFKTADSRSISASVVVADTGLIILPNNMILTDLDEFEVRYLPTEPAINAVDCFKPGMVTVLRYAERAALVEQRLNPEKSVEKIRCLVAQAIAVKGWQAAQTIMNQQDNTLTTTNNYLQLIRDPEVALRIKTACK